MTTIRRRVIRQLAGRSYHLSKARYFYHLHRERRRHPASPLLIFQMGKVGSQTIRASLKALALDMPLFYTHYLTGPYLVTSEEDRKKYFGTGKQHRLEQAWQSQYLRKQIKKDQRRGRRWKVITLTRDPIARNVSMFFQGLDFESSALPHRYRVRSDFVDPTLPDFEIDVDLADTDVLIEKFLERETEERRGSCLSFFDVQLYPIFGIDVFDSDFSPARGYQIYSGDSADVLLIRLESLNRCAAEAFKAFLDIDDFSLVNANMSDDKAYAAVYRRVKESIRFPEDYINQMYGSKFMAHFYSQDEIERFAARWRR